MNILDLFLPVVPWEVFVNGQSLGIFHARTAWGAKRFHRLAAKRIPVPRSEEMFEATRWSLKTASDEMQAKVTTDLALMQSPAFVKLARELGQEMPVHQQAEKFSEELTRGLQWNMENPQRLSDWVVVEAIFVKSVKGRIRDGIHTFGVVHKDEYETFRDQFNASLEAVKLPETIKGIRLTNWPTYCNFQINKKTVSEDDIRQKYGVVTVLDAIKQVKTI